MWKGECPRCGIAAYFHVTWEGSFRDRTYIDVIECPDSHPFVIGTEYGSEKKSIRFIAPISSEYTVPPWLPAEYKDAYAEMMYDFKSNKLRSAVAVAGIILDSHINSLLRNPGDKRMPLGKRMEILASRNLLDPDQFAEGTVARLNRNDVIHPEDISQPIDEAEAKECIEAVSACLERFYKFRRAKALPAPTEQVGDEDQELPHVEKDQTGEKK